ncbi:MAG: N-acetylmuramoyl-L-alanine amidase [Actinomycetaceae bacterium]|nr:N-acetylmuramoyl-L-alanine amidase [Actinomycetaceae bacterium]MDY6082247.1 N-acetylmuramoyl-L-alanine amidase [Actinomycetaceae bacterium]
MMRTRRGRRVNYPVLAGICTVLALIVGFGLWLVVDALADSGRPSGEAVSSSANPVSPAAGSSTSHSAEGADAQARARANPSEPADSSSQPASPLAGLTIVLDPGHNGGNGAAGSKISKPVPDGRGGHKACNTTGTATDAGYTESEFNFNVASELKDTLEAMGASVRMTRTTNTGVGPCVDERGRFGAEAHADLMVSIHGNGSTDVRRHGFFAIVVRDALNADQGLPSVTAAQTINHALNAAGFSAQGTGLVYRNDLATLNFSTVPTVMYELGEMRNAGDAEMMTSHEGQSRYAQALATGIRDWAATR